METDLEFETGEIKLDWGMESGLLQVNVLFEKTIHDLDLDRFRIREHILIKSSKDLVYDGKILFKAGQKIPFYHNGFNNKTGISNTDEDDEDNENNKLKIVVDIRPVIRSEDFLFNPFLFEDYLGFLKNHSLVPYFFYKPLHEIDFKETIFNYREMDMRDKHLN